MTSWRLMFAVTAVLALLVALARLGNDPATDTATWDASRAAGFVAYLLLWLAVTSGAALHLRYRVILSMGWLLELHRGASALGLSLTVAHVLALLVDTERFRVVDAFVPFTTDYRPFDVGLGTLAAWLVVVVLASTAATPALSRAAWKRLHFLSYPAYALALWHGVSAGTDSSAAAATLTYAATAAVAAAVSAARVFGRGWTEAGFDSGSAPAGRA